MENILEKKEKERLKLLFNINNEKNEINEILKKIPKEVLNELKPFFQLKKEYIHYRKFKKFSWYDYIFFYKNFFGKININIYWSYIINLPDTIYFENKDIIYAKKFKLDFNQVKNEELKKIILMLEKTKQDILEEISKKY